MDSETKGCIVCFFIVFLMGSTVAACNMSINYQDNLAMKEMVASGADPLDARCAIMGDHSNSCAMRAFAKGK